MAAHPPLLKYWPDLYYHTTYPCKLKLLLIRSYRTRDKGTMCYPLIHQGKHYVLRGHLYITQGCFEVFLNHPPTYVRTFSLHKVRENCHFLDHPPTPMSLRNIKMAPYIDFFNFSTE